MLPLELPDPTLDAANKAAAAASPDRRRLSASSLSSPGASGVGGDWAAAEEVLCIGAGLSGCVAAHFVKEALPAARVHVWDGARGAGGRLASARFGDGDAVRANMGAQELHFEEDGGPGEQIARVLIEAGAYEGEGVGVLVPLGDSNAACRQLLGGVETRFGARVREIRAACDAALTEERRWESGWLKLVGHMEIKLPQ